MTVEFRIPELRTNRLRMRLPQASDLPDWVAFRAGKRSKSVGGPFDEAASFQHLAAVIGQWQLRGYGRWMVADMDSDNPLGLVGIYHPQDWPEAEIGWSLFDAAEGRGIAHEAALATRAYVVNTLGWSRIVSLISPDNARSIKLAEKLDCVQEGSFDHPVYGTLNIWRHDLSGALE